MNDNTILPVRFMLKEQYKELKDNGEFTGVNTFTGEEETVTDTLEALNCVADTTEQDIAKVQQEVTEVKDQVANVDSKKYLHSFELYVANEKGFYFNVHSSRSTMFASFVDFCEAIGATYTSTLFYPCLYTGNLSQPAALLRCFSETSGLFLAEGQVQQISVTGINTNFYRITEI